MKKLINCLLIVVLFVVSSSFAQSNWDIYLQGERTNFFILPNELFRTDFHVSNDGPNSGNSDHGVLYGYKIEMNKKGIEEFFNSKTFFNTHYWEADSAISRHTYVDSTDYAMIAMSVKSPETAYLMDNLCDWEGKIHEGGPTTNYLAAEILMMTNNGNQGIYKTFSFTKIDGILGDVNDDGFVNEADWEAYVTTNRRWEFRTGRFSEEGLNLGKLILPGHSRTTQIVGPTLLSIWLDNPNDPKVKDIGFGKKISELVYNKSRSYAPEYTQEINDGELLIKTTPKAAVLVYATNPDGTEFKEDKMADENGEVVFKISNENLNYTVEVCKTLDKNENNNNQIINKSKTISSTKFYFTLNKLNFNLKKSDLVNIELFSINGRKISTFNKKLVAGKHTISLEKLNISKGMYVCKIQTADFKKTITVNLK